MDYAEFIVNVGLVRQSMYFMRTYENNHDVDRKESIWRVLAAAKCEMSRFISHWVKTIIQSDEKERLCPIGPSDRNAREWGFSLPL